MIQIMYLYFSFIHPTFPSLSSSKLVIFLTVWVNPIALRKAKLVYNFDLSECNRVKECLNLYLEQLQARTDYGM